MTEEGVDGAELNESAAEVLRRAKDADDDLPENIFDMDHLLEAMPLLRDDNAFFETMNSELGGRGKKKENWCSRTFILTH